MGTEVLSASLLSYVHYVKSNFAKPPDPGDDYQIPADAIKDIRSDPFSGDGSKTPADHLLMIEERCSLFKLSGISQDEVKSKLFYLSLAGAARDWFLSLQHTDRINWEFVKKAFYLKYYTPLKAYGDRCHIYNFWPHPGESISQAWGRLKDLLRKNPSHGLSKSIILINLYVRFSQSHKDFLDNSSGGSFTHQSIEEAWGLLEKISENTDNWDLDKGNKSCLEYEYACVENFYSSPLFAELSDKFSLDSHVLIEIAKAFAAHVSLPKEGFTKYVEPVKPTIVTPKLVKQVAVVSSIECKPYVEDPPFPARMQENLLTTVTNRSTQRGCTPYEQVEVHHQVSAIKELNEEEPCDVYLCEDSTGVIKGKTSRCGKPIISVAIGTSCYHGLCDLGASISAIPYSLYLEVKNDIDPIQMEETGITIQLANKDYISPIGIVRNVEVLVGKIKYPADFMVLACPQDAFCPIIFGRPFLHTVGAEINLPKEKVFIRCAGERLEFNFSKFTDKHVVREPPVKDIVETLAYVAVASSDAVERYILNQDEPFTNEEREAIEQEFYQQPPVLQLNLPPDDLGELPPPKGDPEFELKPLPDNLKYAYLDEKKIYPVIISANLSVEEET
jgi:hypothetical protein